MLLAQTPGAGPRPSAQRVDGVRAGTVPAPSRSTGGHNTNNSSKNSRRRASGPDGGDKCLTQTALLSAECQKRRFNPQFKEWSINDQYYCSVDLAGIVLKCNRSYSTANDAKQALARRAVAEIRKRPCPSPAVGAAAKVARAERMQNETTAGGRRDADPALWSSKPDERSSGFVAGNGHANGSAVPARSRGGQINANEHGMTRTLAPATTLSPHILSDPIASQAFLEGLALGARLYESAQRLKVESVLPRPLLGMQVSCEPHLGRDQERERSPLTGTNRRVRERSPLRYQHHEY